MKKAFFLVFLAVVLVMLASCSRPEKTEPTQRAEAAIKAPAVYAVRVDYSKTIAQMVKEAGVQAPPLVSRVSNRALGLDKQGVKIIQTQLVRLGHDADTAAAKKELADNGLRPANVAELLAFVRDHKDVDNVVSLKQVDFVSLSTVYPYVSNDNNPKKKVLRTRHASDPWTSDAAFLGVKE